MATRPWLHAPPSRWICFSFSASPSKALAQRERHQNMSNFQMELRLEGLFPCVAFFSVFWGGFWHRSHFEGFWNTWKQVGSPRHKMLWEAKIETGWCLQPSKRSAYCDSHSKYQAKRLAIDVDIGYCKAPLPLGAKLLCREPSWLAVQQILLFQSIAIVNSMYWICFACTVAPFFSI